MDTVVLIRMAKATMMAVVDAVEETETDVVIAVGPGESFRSGVPSCQFLTPHKPCL